MSERQHLLSGNNNDANLAQLLSKTYGDITGFEKQLREIGTQRDTNTFRSELYKRKVEISDNLKYISSRLKQPNSTLPKIQKEKILKDLQDATKRFEELMQLSQKKESASKPINDPESIEHHKNSFREAQNFGGRTNNNNNYNNNNSNYGSNNYGNNNNYNPYDQQYQNQDGGNGEKKSTFGLGGQMIDQDQIYNDIIEERNIATRQLVDDMKTLQEVMGDVSMMVNEQGEQLVQANNNVMTADHNVEAATDELEQALVYKTSYRKKVFFLLICLGVTFAGLIIFLGVYFGVFKKRK